ncbi:TetR/AcrR family transcriptional regulator [Tautonia plasticadhaerens]|uniref:Transcriptional regulator AcuR n=1 Tax=Tautonia plasticadhaerens TaxID=2527974 RepID=A0A518H4F5_9BACT|nr:TetR/AcrR family transcriptional regulator [Tautonia plasticadhaerens]QDV35720.1 Transcriptional regulator AcuR [Tautonia plasticadhaerens]
MGDREKTREALLEVGRRVFLEKGYSGAGLDAVLKAAGVPKGSFYYYFGSKEDFGLAVVDSFVEESDRALEAALEDRAIEPLVRLRRYFEAAAERFEGDRCRSGCLVGKLSQELAEQSETFRRRLSEAFDAWTVRVASCLEEARGLGELPAELDARALAELLTDGWQGSLLRAKTLQSPRPLRIFIDVMFRTVLRGPG